MNNAADRSFIRGVKRVVIKVGSGVLTRDDGLDISLIRGLAKDIAALKNRGTNVVLVSSGAIASGLKKMGHHKGLRTVQEKQAIAAIGQPSLILAYENSFKRYDKKVAQILLTANDLANRPRYLNARNTLTTLLNWGIIPIVNENDTVVVEEIKFGDNDTLSSLITGVVEADLLINLTDMDGLFDRDPRKDPEAVFIPLVRSVTKKIETLAGAIPGALGTGGMYTKVIAAKRVGQRGIPAIIANGKKKGVISAIMSGADIGTLFMPKGPKLGHRKHWIAYTSKIRGRVAVDDGAREALLKKGKSLLPSGIIRVDDRFGRGDTVEVVSRRGKVLAVGLINYTSEELELIAGRQTSEIESILGFKNSDEVIHRDNMAVGLDLAR